MGGETAICRLKGDLDRLPYYKGDSLIIAASNSSSGIICAKKSDSLYFIINTIGKFCTLYTCFQCCVHRQHLRSFFDMPSFNAPSFNMLFKWLKDCLTVKQAIFLGLLVEEKTNDNYWRHMAEEDCEHCMFPDLWDN